MKTTSYASNAPFWIKLDIDGRGKRWLLAFLRRGDDGKEIVFPTEDFEDSWDAERFSKYEQRLILSPDQESKADADMSQALNEGEWNIPAMSETPYMDQMAYPLMSAREHVILQAGRKMERKMAIYEEALRTIATDPCNPRLDYIGIADEALDEARDILSNVASEGQPGKGASHVK